MYTPRLTRPEAGNKYYIRKASGGYSPAIPGKPTDADCDVLSNCVGYAIGRFNEIGGYEECRYLPSTNAELFIQKNPDLKVSQIAHLGACAVWRKGDTYGSGDGAGHVAIVEQIISPTEIVTSESGWGAKNPFWIKRRSKGDGNWGQGSGYHFLGFILNPAVSAEDEEFSGEIVHIVAPGEWLSTIAINYGVDWEELAEYNGIENPDLIKPGQPIRIPAVRPESPALILGDVVHIADTCTTYANGKSIPSWVKSRDLFVRKIDGDKVTVSTVSEGAVTGTVYYADLVHVTVLVGETEEVSGTPPEIEQPEVIPEDDHVDEIEDDLLEDPADDDSIEVEIVDETNETEDDYIRTPEEAQNFLVRLLNVIIDFIVKLFGGGGKDK